MSLPLFYSWMMTFWAGFYTRQAYIQDNLYSRQAYIQDMLLFKTCLYSRQAYIQDRLIFKTCLYSRQAYIQDRLMCSSCAIISSIHSAEHAYRNSTFVVLFMTSHTINSIKTRFCKPRLLFESGICLGMQLQKCRFYSRATSIRERLLFKGGFYTRLYGICFLLAFVRLGIK